VNAMILPVILCGGSGTRLWPASRESMPKQFIQLIEGGLSMFQLTAERVAAAEVFLKPLVIANCDARFIVAAQLAAIGITADIILEPQRRDSAAAVAVAAAYAAARHPDAIVLVMSADHLIDDPEAFVSSCKIAVLAAASGAIMTLGIRPTRAASAYGYIAPGSALPGIPHAFEVERFFEKPDEAAAQRYIDGGYLW
jgi:mannose-1-phosphate guanylyltransferase/mannose-6-phosphate isomerase